MAVRQAAKAGLIPATREAVYETTRTPQGKKALTDKVSSYIDEYDYEAAQAWLKKTARIPQTSIASAC